MKKILLTIIAAVALAGGGAAFYFYGPFAGNSRVLKLPGTVETQEVRLASKVGGRVKRVAVREGEMVSAGQVVVEFEAPELEAQRAQYQAKVDAAEAQRAKAYRGARPEEKAVAKASLSSAEARLSKLIAGFRDEEIDQARRELEIAEAESERANAELARERKLYPAVTSAASYELAQAIAARWQLQARAAQSKLALLLKGTRSEEIAEAMAERDRARANFDLVEAGTREEEILEADARVAELKARLSEIVAQLKEAVVVAPERAIVEVVAVRPGDVVPANQPVVRVLRADDLWVKTFVSEVHLGKVHVNQTVEVTIDSHPGVRFTGTVIQIASSSEFTPRNVQSLDERRNQVFALKVRVVDPRGVFKSGMAADVWVNLE